VPEGYREAWRANQKPGLNASRPAGLLPACKPMPVAAARRRCLTPVLHSEMRHSKVKKGFSAAGRHRVFSRSRSWSFVMESMRRAGLK
jgi:hypothetical protein